MPGVSFDRAAAFYDATRALPDGVAEAVRDALLVQVGARPDTRFLEVGVGTGRIALPFIRAGHAYCGVDLSGGMLGALRDKLAAGPRPGLVQGDAMRLPCRGGVFDVALLFHVIHLVDDPRATLDEVRRVLRPTGRVVISTNDYDERAQRNRGRTDTAQFVISRWNAILGDLGIDRSKRPWGGWVPDEELIGDLERRGAVVERAVLARYRERPRTARQVATAHRDRVFSSDWRIPDDVHAEASRRLMQWLEREHPALDEPFTEDGAVAVLVGTFSSPAGSSDGTS